MVVKHNLLFFFAVLLTPFLAVANKDNVYINVSTLENPGDTISIIQDNYYLSYKTPIKKSVTDETGHCKFLLYTDKARTIQLLYKGKSIDLFIIPNDSLFIKITQQPLSWSVAFTGKGSTENSFLQSFNTKFSDELTGKEFFNRITNSSGIDAYENYLYVDKKLLSNYYKSNVVYPKLSNDFKHYIESLIKYNYLNALYAYPIVNGNNNKSLVVQQIPAVMLDGFDNNNITDDNSINIDQYRSFLKYYVAYATSETNGFNKFTDYSTSMERKFAVANMILKKVSLNHWMTTFLVSEYSKAQPDVVKRMFQLVKNNDAVGVYTAYVEFKCGKYMKTALQLPSATNNDAEITKAFKIKNEQGLEVSLADFKGKVIYMDFWASWCGPCRQQFPYSKMLHAKFNEKQLKKIVFLYISIDDNEDAWHKAILENQLEGNQGISKGGWSSEASRFFNITSIPRYVIIDKKGNISDHSAKRPSEEGIYEDIVKLLEE
jgi:thiol-disulfide isomerase/thioredoxin